MERHNLLKSGASVIMVCTVILIGGCESMADYYGVGPSSRCSAYYPTGNLQDTRSPGDVVRSWDLSYVKELTDFKALQSKANMLGGGGRTGPGWKALDERRRQWYVENTPDLDPDTAKLILAGELKVGMSMSEAFASWGFPNDANTTHTAHGRHDQCTYRVYEGSATALSSIGVYNRAWAYLYFDNHVLTSWQVHLGDRAETER